MAYLDRVEMLRKLQSIREHGILLEYYEAKIIGDYGVDFYDLKGWDIENYEEFLPLINGIYGCLEQAINRTIDTPVLRHRTIGAVKFLKDIGFDIEYVELSGNSAKLTLFGIFLCYTSKSKVDSAILSMVNIFNDLLST